MHPSFIHGRLQWRSPSRNILMKRDLNKLLLINSTWRCKIELVLSLSDASLLCVKSHPRAAAAYALQQLGLSNATDIIGGCKAW